MPAATGKIVKGSKGRIDFGGGFYGNLAKYSIAESVTELDQKSFESAIDANHGGIYDDGDADVTKDVVTISGYYDGANNPFSAAAPNLNVGVYLSNVKIYIDKTNVNRNYAYTSLQVMEAKVDGEVGKRVEFSCTLHSRGSIVRPV